MDLNNNSPDRTYIIAIFSEISITFLPGLRGIIDLDKMPDMSI